MKTRLLALVLACLMVLSVMPVVAFAETVCQYAAKDGDHTLATTKGTEKYLETVKPQCGGQWGYDLFKCTGCGEHFADNFVKPANVEHDLELVDKGIASTCQVAGVSAKYACLNCDYTEGGKALPVAAHKYEIVGENAGTCGTSAQVTKKCTVCGATRTDGVAKDHDWKMVEETVVKPYLNEEGKLVNGMATYSCGNCKATKEVVIIAEHDCVLEKVEAKAATCFAAGNVEYWECTHSYCNKKYNAKGELLETVIVEPTHAWAEHPNVVEATCTTWGYVFYGCLICGATNTTESTEPYGHTTFDDLTSQNKLDTFTECQKPGERTWNCGRCGEAQKETIDAHELKTAEFAATCARPAYKFQYCTICDASKQAPTATANGIVYDLSVPVYDENGVFVERKLYVVNGAVSVGVELDPENHDWMIKDTNPATCTTDGDRVWYCVACANVFRTEVVLAYHKLPQGEPVKKVAATCTDNAYNIYLCKHCNKQYALAYPNTATGHAELVYQSTVLPTCTDKGYDIYKCPNCDYTEKQNETENIKYVLGTFYTEIKGDNSYASKEEYKDNFVGYFADAHPNAVKKDIHIQGNCLKLGLYRYWCDDCDTYILVAMPGTGLGHYNDDDYTDSAVIDGKTVTEIKPIKPTCTTDGAHGQFICDSCGTLVAEKLDSIEKTGHDMTKVTDIPADKCQIDYYSCNNCKNLYLDEKGYEQIADFLTHILTVTDNRVVTCEKFGYTHHECTNCKSVKAEFIDEFVDALGHNWTKTEGKPATCVEAGVKDLWVCDKTCCEKEIHPVNNGAVIPATGIHVNAEGREFRDLCDDPETLRDCVLCNTTVGRNHKFPTTPIEVDATCQDYGYFLYICDRYEKCGEHYVVAIDGSVLGDHKLGEWHVSTENSNLMVRECVYGCGHFESKKIADVEYFAEVQNVNGNVGCTDSSLINVTIKIKADTPLWGVRFDVKYDSTLLEFKSAEFVSDKFTKEEGSGVNGAVKGVVTIAAGAVSTDNKPVDVTIEGKEALVVLTFRIDLPLDASGLPVVGIAKTSTTITVEPIDTLNKDHKDLLAQGDVETFEILPFMDVNLDGKVNMNDALYMYEILRAGNGYKVALDIDQNGAIEYRDYMALYQYLVYAYSYEYVTDEILPID